MSSAENSTEHSTAALLQHLAKTILEYSGINLAQSQLSVLDEHIKQKAASRNMTPQFFCDKLKPFTPDFDEIINLVTVNETYFFREEAQFDFLKKEVFPKYAGRNLTLWSCCCATGEEPISLLALALSMNVNISVYASDIDTEALDKIQHGHYSLYSLRDDGKKYHDLLKPYSKRTDREIIFEPCFLKRIHTFKFNLLKDTQLPFFENADIIFMRNVFIYFDKETRTFVTHKVTERLKEDGLLFFSVNEVGSIDDTVIPKNMSKRNSGMVYYFAKSQKNTQNFNSYFEERHRERLNQKKLQTEIEKVKKISKPEAKKPQEPVEKPAEKTSPANVLDLKKIYEEVCKNINTSDFEKARSATLAITGTENKKYSFFIQGYIEYHADNRAAAETLFASSESLSSDFWPAYFYHGLVLRDMEKKEKAGKCFAKCKSILTQMGDNNPYDFTLDDFSPAYIHSLCETLGGEL